MLAFERDDHGVRRNGVGQQVQRVGGVAGEHDHIVGAAAEERGDGAIAGSANRSGGGGDDGRGS